MNLGIITYNKKHKKTQEVLKGLIKKKKYRITLLITKFKSFRKRETYFKHRPYQFVGLNPKQLKKKHDIKIKILNKSNLKLFDKVIICGSGLINSKMLVNDKIINCHSGLIPETRGLDSLKWAIIKLKKVGNSLHYIDKNVDLGRVISHKATKLLKKDTLKSFSDRHYNNEIKMLINFEKYLSKPQLIKLRKKKENLRMNINIEKKIDKYFALYKKKFLNK